MEERPEKCPSCYAPLDGKAGFCKQCGSDLAEPDPGPAAAPRPEQCPFCAAPIQDWSPACKQCGFDLASDWRPASEDEAKEVFDPQVRACSVCGELNLLTADFCRKCGAPVGSYSALKPVETIFAEGFLYRRAIQRLPGMSTAAQVGRLLLAGLLLGSAAASAGLALSMGRDVLGNLFNPVVPAENLGAFTGPLMFLALAPLWGYLGYRILRPRRRAESRAAASQPEAEPPDEPPNPE